MPQLNSQEEKGGEFLFSSSLCSVQAFEGFQDAQPQWEGPSPLLSPRIQMLFSS